MRKLLLSLLLLPALAFAQPTFEGDAETPATDSLAVGTPDAGDLLLALVGGRGGTPDPAISGWNRPALSNLTGAEAWYSLLWRISDGSSSNVTITGAGTTTLIIASIAEIAGINASVPINALNATQHTSSTETFVSPSITTTVDDCLIISGVIISDGRATRVLTLDGSLTQFVNNRSGTTSSDTLLAAGYASQATAGATGTFTHTLVGADIGIAFTIAIAPEVEGGGGLLLRRRRE